MTVIVGTGRRPPRRHDPGHRPDRGPAGPAGRHQGDAGLPARPRPREMIGRSASAEGAAEVAAAGAGASTAAVPVYETEVAALRAEPSWRRAGGRGATGRPDQPAVVALMCHAERDDVFRLLADLGARPVDSPAELASWSRASDGRPGVGGRRHSRRRIRWRRRAASASAAKRESRTRGTNGREAARPAAGIGSARTLAEHGTPAWTRTQARACSGRPGREGREGRPWLIVHLACTRGSQASPGRRGLSARLTAAPAARLPGRARRARPGR